MIKSKYILNRIVGLTSGTALAIPMMANNVYAADKAADKNDHVDLSSAKMDANGKLKITGSSGDSTKDTVSVFNTIMDKGRILISGFTGICSIILVGLFVMKAFNLSKSSDNPQERSKCINSLIFYFIGAALFGAASLFSGLFYNLFN